MRSMGEYFSLDDGEIDLDGIAPTAVNGGGHEEGVRAICRGVSERGRPGQPGSGSELE